MPPPVHSTVLAVGQSQALRLIQQEKVAALLGAYQSSVTFAATAVAERYGVPWVVGDSVSDILAGQRGAPVPPVEIPGSPRTRA